MKKTIALILTLCTLLCTLTACKSRRSKYLPKDTGTETDTSTGDVGDAKVSRYIHGDNPYAGMTAEELKDLYFSTESNSSFATPYYFLLEPYALGVTVFSKLTGEIMTLCKDPLCDHKNCTFSKPIYGLTVTEDRIITVQSSNGVTEMYSYDYNFNDAKKLMTWSSAEDGPLDYLLYYWEGKLYYQLHYRMNGETVERTCVFDLKSNTQSWLEPEETMHISHMWEVYDGYLYYWRTGSASTWRYDLKTGEDICVLVAEDILNYEEGDLGVLFQGVEDGVLHITITYRNGDTNGFRPYFYYIDTKELKPVYSSTQYRIGENVIAIRDHIHDESFRDDPFYDLYTNTFVTNPLGRHDSKYGGDLYYSPVGQTNAEPLVRIHLDGIPVSIESNTGRSYIGCDGKCMYVRIATYMNYKNQYNPDWNKESVKDLSPDELLYLHSGWLVIDVENQKALTICQDDVEYEWYPEFDWYTDGNN